MNRFIPEGNVSADYKSKFLSVAWWLRFVINHSSPRELRLIASALRHRRMPALPEEVWRNISSIGGFLTMQEAGLLYWVARNCTAQGPIIELGSYEGRSTGVFAMAGREVCCVDAWSNEVKDQSVYQGGAIQAGDVFERFQANIRMMKIEKMVTVHRGLTREIGQSWNRTGAVLFIDAGHEYEDAKADIEIWSKHLHKEGMLVIHDVLGRMPGVTRAASEIDRKLWHIAASCGSAVVFVRK